VSFPLSSKLRERHVSIRRLLAGGVLAAALAAIAGTALELWRFGPNSAAAAARVEQQVRRDFDRMTAILSRVAEGVAGDSVAARGLEGGPDAARDLFDLIDRQLTEAGTPADEIAVTIYDVGGCGPSTPDRCVARAWAGRPSDVRVPGRLTGPSSFFVTQSPLGLRLVHVRPILAVNGSRVGAVAAEYVLSAAPVAATLTATDSVLETSLGPATLRMRWEGAGDEPRPNAFLLHAPAGDPLVEVSMSPAALAAARQAWRRRVVATIVAIAGVTLLLLIGPVLDRRSAARNAPVFVRLTALALAWLACGSLAIGVALAIEIGSRPPPSVLLLLGGMTFAAAVGLIAGPVVRLRVAARAARRSTAASLVRFYIRQLLAGACMAALLVMFERLLPRAVNPATVDLRHFSLHPWNATRLALLTGILACHAAALWTSTLMLSAALAHWRVSASATALRLRIVLCWLAPSAILAALAQARGWALPPLSVAISAFACAIAALSAQRVAVWYRHATVAARILALFVAFLVPALLLYPSVDYFAEGALRSLIASQYAVQAQQHSETLQQRLSVARQEIDQLADLPSLVIGEPELQPPSVGTQSAYYVWSHTALARGRLTSAVELYNAQGVLVSRFALYLPEYSGTPQVPQVEAASPCEWDVFGEAAPFGAEERRMLHAARQVCTAAAPGAPPRPVGTVVVHVLFDYRTLPFIAPQNPYFEVFRPVEGEAPREGTTGSEVDAAIYGWGLGAMYSSPHATWSIGDDLFRRIYDPARRPFWTTIRTGDGRYHVYFSNDRVFIYAIGYRALTPFDHLVHLAELTTLSGALYVVVLFGTAMFTRMARARPRLGRALLREIRASFYRKLFLAFVLASIIPVLTLALAIRWYFANLLTADVALEAARTAAVAQRVIEQSNALIQRTEGLEAASDDVMIWISQVIDQDVNIFEGAKLVATSQRDLFASGLLAERTPDAVYRAIALQRLPSFVGEDRIGTVSYTIAAAPVHAGGRQVILTVPLATRQRDIDREIDDLDRGVHLAALFFILLGAGIGVSMAERIADPVRRLTRATQRIAHGDFDAQIAVRTSDELRRLVDAFNSMAAELKAQRAQLERTHRLEAWAEMARQVAHEIKNPLTPIQLSAEHLRRVHADRGEPMGDVLESCVASILGQVKLLRQISAEFSSFASSPTAKPSSVDVPELVAEVVEPYRTGLAGRIEVINRVAPPLPRVFVDRTLVARSLANIIENALHAMPGTGTLTIDGGTTPQAVVLRISDTGLGMDEDALARVFEPYFSTKTTGTGLGLPIARRNIELNGGSIDVESTKGRGTTVIVRLPVAEEMSSIAVP
jgi:signal transduction histidine kinase